MPWRMTSIFSIRGLFTLKVRSTPTPLAIRRTVIERVMPPPRRRMTVPSKTWTRSRFPSTTRADTLTVSPELSSGRSVRIWSWTISSSTFTIDPYSWRERSVGCAEGVSGKAARATEGEEYHNVDRSRRDGARVRLDDRHVLAVRVRHGRPKVALHLLRQVRDGAVF